jgi:nucleotide-binding universal stress UspA family protein
LAELAREKEADLLVLGTHPRGTASRLWHGSVSRNAIHEADCNVLCVPLRQVSVHAGTAPQTIVVPTDFSALGDRAISYGYGLLGRGGSLHLVHVVPRLVDSDVGALKAQLAARIPEETASRGISTELHVLESDEAWRAIWQQAGRASADLICLASHSRKGAGNLLLGSQAKALLQHSRIPVLIVPPDREG